MAGSNKDKDKRNTSARKKLSDDDSLLQKVKDSDSNRPLDEVEAPEGLSGLFSKEYKSGYDPNATVEEDKSADSASPEDLDKLKDRLTAAQEKKPDAAPPTPTLADMVKFADEPPPAAPKSTTSSYKPTKLSDKFNTYYEQARAAISDVPPAQRDEFTTELAGLKQQYKDAQSDIDKRELIETVANALGKIGGGMYGLKTGTDMSKLSFGKHDFGADRDRALKENQLGLSDLADRRREQIASDQHAEDVAFRKDSQAQQTALAHQNNDVARAHLGLSGDQLAETIRHDKAMEDVYGAKIGAMTASSLGKASGKELEQLNKGAEELSNKISAVAAGLNKKDYDEDTAKEQIKTYLMSDLNMSDAQAQQAVSETGWFGGDNLRDPSEILKTVNGLFAQQRTIVKLKQRTPQGSVLVVAPDGTPGYLPEAQADAAAQANYRVFK